MTSGKVPEIQVKNLELFYLEDEDIKMIYDSVIRTRDNEKKDNSKTSEYFQYKGIEANLKETINGDKSIYQFRIGRITE